MMTSPLRAFAAVTSSQSRKLLYWSPRSPGLWLTAICCVRPAPSESVRVTTMPSSTPSSRKAWRQARILARNTSCGTVTLPSWCPHCFSAVLLLLIWRGAGARLDHLLGEQIGRLRIAEAGVDVGDDGHDMGLEAVDLLDQRLLLCLVAVLAGGVERAEDVVQLARV